ncbi:MAG: hypothetical protein JW991_01440 [Candidatus Pacebacteria bacterium]|nr:hypothetical protein [Candidatus Paceibacterota bacterium]
MKRVLFGLFFLSVFYLMPQPLLAFAEFDTGLEAIYRLQDDSWIKVSQAITLTNKKADFYASEYYLTVGDLEIRDIRAFDGLGPIDPSVEETDQGTKLKFVFNERVVGQGKTLTFHLGYLLGGAMLKNGEVWEVRLPRIPALEDFNYTRQVLAVPKSFGEPAFISPEGARRSQDDTWWYFSFEKEILNDQSVSAAFGKFQIFDFQLQYHLENPHSNQAIMQIALPPDSFFQKIYLESLSPRPENIEADGDGNWLASYSLRSKERIDIQAKGWVQIFSQSWGFPYQPDKKQLEANLAGQEYWPVNNTEIQARASELKTPAKIYQFVVDHLNYDYSDPDEKRPRRGALAALRNPDNSICMEFSDLFVTLARASGIPCREINGYAYTTNPQLKPADLFVDILHSWPEYWVEDGRYWQPVDPTWGKSTGGRDYFSKMDLNHFGLAIHGFKSDWPLPAGAYKTGSDEGRDIKISFGQYRPTKNKDLEIRLINNNNFFFWPKFPLIQIYNPGPNAIYQTDLVFFSETIKFRPGFQKEQHFPILPPLGQISLPVQIKYSSLLTPKSAELKVFINGQEFVYLLKTLKLLWVRIFLAGFLIIALIFLTALVSGRKRQK